jgi:polygalacturonase
MEKSIFSHVSKYPDPMKTILITLSLLTIGIWCHGAVYNIKDFGAVENQLSTPAIQKAVDACHTAGGGMVLVPAGKFITGTIELKSKVELHLEQGAVLQGSKNIADYKTTFRRHGIVFCLDAEQVAISGEGIIDAQGITFYDTTKSHVYPEFDKSLTRQKEQYMPEDQFFSDGPLKRIQAPGMTLTFYHCNQVTLKDFTLKDTPVWAIRLAYCDDVRVTGLSILNNLMIPNSDGIHCTTSRNVRISDCDIRAGDDAIIVTGFALEEEIPGFAHSDQGQYVHGNKTIYAENVSVTNCQLQSRSAGIRIGYGQHPIRRCTFSNIVIHGSNRGIGIFAHDASDIEELIFNNITIEAKLHNGQWWGNGEPIHLSSISRFEGEPAGRIRHVQFNNIIATGEEGILLYGLEESRMENIRFSNVHLTITMGKETLAYGGNFDLRPAADPKHRLFEHGIPGIYAQCIDGLLIRDFRLDWGNGLPSFFTHGIECFDVNKLVIENFEGGPNPTSQGSERVVNKSGK